MVKKRALEAAYRATTYRVFLPGENADLRIGQPNAVLNAWLARSSISTFAIISAYNPGSQQVDVTKNVERQLQLESDLSAEKYAFHAGENVPDDDSGLLEKSCFVPDMTLEEACALAANFGQNAVVCGAADGIPLLVWVEQVEK